MSGNADMSVETVRMVNITKAFGKIVANENINLKVHKGEVHALLGENGAGKTTLVNMLYGLLKPTSGEIFVRGEKLETFRPDVAIEKGIGMVHQHFMLVQPFTVVENIMLGMEKTKGPGILNREQAKKDVIALSEKYGLYVEPDAKIEDITVGMQQRVEILKALYRGADILILDEPTAVLTPQEIEELVSIIDSLTKQGKSIIIITHKLKEIKKMADYCTIIRRGKYIDTVKVSDVSESDLASKMVGREVSFEVEKEDKVAGETVLKIENLVVKDSRGIDAVKGLSLEVRKGEILGVAGIDGNGQSQLIEGITGLSKVESGHVYLNNKDITNKKPREIIESGIATIPEDRQKRGLVLDFSVSENMILENYGKAPFSKKGVLDYKRIKEYTKGLIERFDIRPDNEDILASSLSGGNQQKVIIAREVTNNPDVLIAAQPTRGLDVGAIEFVHKSLVEQRDNDKAVLLISFELDEVINVSDRIAVLYDGQIVDILNANETDENEIGLMMAGGGGESE